MAQQLYLKENLIIASNKSMWFGGGGGGGGVLHSWRALNNVQSTPFYCLQFTNIC